MVSGMAGPRKLFNGPSLVGFGNALSQARTIGLMRLGQITFGDRPSQPMN